MIWRIKRTRHIIRLTNDYNIAVSAVMTGRKKAFALWRVPPDLHRLKRPSRRCFTHKLKTHEAVIQSLAASARH